MYDFPRDEILVVLPEENLGLRSVHRSAWLYRRRTLMAYASARDRRRGRSASAANRVPVRFPSARLDGRAQHLREDATTRANARRAERWPTQSRHTVRSGRANQAILQRLEPVRSRRRRTVNGGIVAEQNRNYPPKGRTVELVAIGPTGVVAAEKKNFLVKMDN